MQPWALLTEPLPSELGVLLQNVLQDVASPRLFAQEVPEANRARRERERAAFAALLEVEGDE